MDADTLFSILVPVVSEAVSERPETGAKEAEPIVLWKWEPAAGEPEPEGPSDSAGESPDPPDNPESPE